VKECVSPPERREKERKKGNNEEWLEVSFHVDEKEAEKKKREENSYRMIREKRHGVGYDEPIKMRI